MSNRPNTRRSTGPAHRPPADRRVTINYLASVAAMQAEPPDGAPPLEVTATHADRALTKSEAAASMMILASMSRMFASMLTPDDRQTVIDAIDAALLTMRTDDGGQNAIDELNAALLDLARGGDTAELAGHRLGAVIRAQQCEAS